MCGSRMLCRGLVVLLVIATTGAVKKQKLHKPGRAVLDRLSSTTVGERVQVAAGSRDRGLAPAPVDVAGFAVVTANATCGVAGPEEFCRDTPGKKERGTICDVCEGAWGARPRRHPPDLATDGDSATWWQSPTLAAGAEYEHVELVAGLPDKMELLHVIIKSGPSPRPLAWSLEVSPSDSGDSWRLVKAFGDREHCRRLWDLRPERRRRKARATKRSHKEKPSCSTQFANLKPLENGEMHVALGEGTLARRVRVSFRAPHPLPAVQQYYTVRELTLAARCICHGHADECRVDAKGAKCECQHGTCGLHCQRCCAGGDWRAHAPCDGSRPCECGERGVCEPDDSGAILCVNCTDNRAGPLCDRCLARHYSAAPDGPCLPCRCDAEGSDGSCIWDPLQHMSQCRCNPGFTGPRCEVCEDPAASYPRCLTPATEPACKCDPRGIVDPARTCDDVCECKVNVVGERCDTCAPGHFGLSVDLPAGCRPCYCSRRAASCVAQTEPAEDMEMPLGAAWRISDLAENQTVRPEFDQQGKPFLIIDDVEDWESFYWMSSVLSGSQLALYGAELRVSMFWGVVRGDTGGNPISGPDVILLGADGTKLAYSNTTHETAGLLELAIPLLEEGWYNLEDPAEPIDRSRLMDVLADLRGILLRAHFHMDQDEVRLEAASLVAGAAGLTEVCQCGAGYAGAQCERCAWSHALFQNQCVPCDCNNHADCDSVGGPCGACLHNTTGLHCERCLPGHYGNPVQGSCKPCACPLYEASNNFSPNCALASAEGDEFVCTQCPDGYSGDHCEFCDVGYWGSPTTLGGSCQPCVCGGGACDPRTGVCHACPPHAEGAQCERCQEGYYALRAGNSSSCVECGCGAGALAAACDARAGQCVCRAGWTGRTCDGCAPGHGGIEAGCPACECGLAALSPACDGATGACACATGAAPPHCDHCLPEYYGLTKDGCLGCNCSALGADSNVCDIRSGQCRCKPHVTGRACDTCEEGYWGLQLGGCRRCACGSGAAACEPITGLCACAAGVGGDKCDRCLPGFYGFGPNGCLPCPPCDDGKVCSPESGRCVCPGRTRGPGCRQCAPGSWRSGGHCRPCRCGPGAVSEQCDPATGHCRCRGGWAGPDCARCSTGHAGPRCRPCACDAAGSTGPCDERGRCPCKENVVGEKCDRCLEGTFGLSADNAQGCTACFCFGRSTSCTQAQLARAAVHQAAPTHLVLQRSDALGDIDQDSLLSIHTRSREASISIPHPPVPVYMELGARFLGDKVTSYGGFLKFRVEEEGGDPLGEEELVRFPLVRIYGRRIVLDYYERIPPESGWHSIRFHESLWRVRGRGRGAARGAEIVASRSALMLALSKVERILIRVSTRAPTYQDKVHVLLLNVSMDTTVPGHSRSESAVGVELCACDAVFAPPSCHAPAPGFWMPKQDVHYNEVAGTIVITLEGQAQPCSCNGRAAKCDPDTGHCLNCTGHWSGPQCASCAAGYYEWRGACVSCACDAPPCQPRPHPRCQCPTGYSGRDCTDCAPGYHRTNGVCAACGCSPWGSVTQQCNDWGQCHCKPFATGMRCDRCIARTQFLYEGGCQECDNCTQTLLSTVENLTSDLHQRANINELNRIPKPFPALLEFARNATITQANVNQLAEELKHSRNIDNLIENLEGTEHDVFTKANQLKTEAARRAEEANFLSLESMAGLEEATKYRQKIGVQVMELDEFARGEKHTSAHRALKEARHLLRQIKEIKLNGYLTGANDVFDSAHLQSTAIQEYKYRTDDLSRRLAALVARLDAIQAKSEDFRLLGDVIWDAGDVVEATTKEVKPRMGKIKDVALRCRLVSEDIATLNPHNLTLNTNYALLQAQTLVRHFPSFITELEKLKAAAEEKEGILYDLTPKYREKYLKQVERHVEELGRQAKQYKSVFAGARAASSSGVVAARAWSDVVAAVRDAAAAADHAHAAALQAAAIARPDQTLKDRAKESEDVSRVLRERAMELLRRTDELRSHLDQLHRAGDVVSILLRALGWQERELAQRPSVNVKDTLAEADVVAERVFATTRALYDEASEVRRRVRYSLRRQLAELQRHADTAVSATQEHVSQILRNSERGSAAAAALGAAAAARRAEARAAAARLGPSLDKLRQAVDSARHAAGTISVSITSAVGAAGAAAGCSRRYAVRGQAPAVSRYSVEVSFDGAVRDGPLLTVLDDTQDPHRYIKLVVLQNHFHLSWDLGDGTGVVVHPDLLQASHDDADHTSYRVQIERIWSTFHLTVERAGQPSTTASNATGGGTRLLARQLWLGAPAGGLPGCVHAVRTRDEVLGLWSGTKGAGKCAGCTQRFWSTGSSRQNMVYFSGAGYSAPRRSALRPADAKYFTVSFSFKTRDRDALLFLAVDEANNRSVSVSLRACRVVFAVQYAGARLQLTAAGRHCTGRPAHVQATRAFSNLDKGSLRVNGEETLGSPSPPVQSKADLPDLSTAVYWVGGLGPRGLRWRGELPPPLRGCIGGLAVNREGYDLMDTPTRFGVEPACGTRSIHSGIFAAGYVELPSPAVRRKAALGLDFRARGADGLLLYRAPAAPADNDTEDQANDSDPDQKHYLLIQMVQGEIEVIASAGREEARLRTNGSRFDDKRLHSLRLHRQHKQIELWIDDTKLSSAPFSGNAIPARSRGLFLGGTPTELSQGNRLLTAPGFEGTIADLVVDSMLIDLESALNWTNVQLGRADVDAEDAPRSEPRTLQSQPDPNKACSKTASFTVEAGAAKFGDAAGSYARLRTPTRGSDIVYSLQFRTYAANGLLLFAPGPKSKPKHYLALLVRDHRLRLVVRGRKRKEVALPASVTDGTWRTVWVRAGRGRAVLRSGGQAAAAAGGAARAHHVMLGGAVSSDLLPRPITKVGGFRGCIRRVAVNGRPEDLVRDAKAHRGLGQCFPNVEPAAYFGGDAYAVWSRSYSPTEGAEVSSELRLEFRTMAPSGVLLAAPPLTLMLKDGMVVFSRATTSGTVSAEWRGASGSGGACDGAWHSVAARASRGSLTLLVDGSHVSAPAASLLADEPTVGPLYVASAPEGTTDPSESKEPFRGCIRNLSVGGHTKDWIAMDTLHNVLLDSCPAQQ